MELMWEVLPRERKWKGDGLWGQKQWKRRETDRQTHRVIQREKEEEEEEMEIGEVLPLKGQCTACPTRRCDRGDALCQVLKGWGQVYLDANSAHFYMDIGDLNSDLYAFASWYSVSKTEQFPQGQTMLFIIYLFCHSVHILASSIINLTQLEPFLQLKKRPHQIVLWANLRCIFLTDV